MNYSLTQAGNLGQLIAIVLIVTGMNQEEAEAGSQALVVAFGVLAHLGGFLASWYGRYRNGGINILGFRKE